MFISGAVEEVKRALLELSETYWSHTASNSESISYLIGKGGQVYRIRFSYTLFSLLNNWIDTKHHLNLLTFTPQRANQLRKDLECSIDIDISTLTITVKSDDKEKLLKAQEHIMGLMKEFEEANTG